jgi:hypothetical protein
MKSFYTNKPLFSIPVFLLGLGFFVAPQSVWAQLCPDIISATASTITLNFNAGNNQDDEAAADLFEADNPSIVVNGETYTFSSQTSGELTYVDATPPAIAPTLFEVALGIGCGFESVDGCYTIYFLQTEITNNCNSANGSFTFVIDDIGSCGNYSITAVGLNGNSLKTFSTTNPIGDEESFLVQNQTKAGPWVFTITDASSNQSSLIYDYVVVNGNGIETCASTSELLISKTVDAPGTYSGPGQTLTYTYTITTSGGDIPGPITVTDDKIPTVTYSSGDDGDGTLESGESWIYTGSYSTTPADVTAGSVTNIAFATAPTTASTTSTATATYVAGCSPDAGTIDNNNDNRAILEVCNGVDFFNSIPEEVVFTATSSAPSFYEYAFLLVEEPSGDIQQYNETGNFDFSGVTAGQYSVYGLSYSDTNTPESDVTAYLDNLTSSPKNISEIIADDDDTSSGGPGTGSYCLDLGTVEAVGATTTVIVFEPFTVDIISTAGTDVCEGKADFLVLGDVAGGSETYTTFSWDCSGGPCPGGLSINDILSDPTIYNPDFKSSTLPAGTYSIELTVTDDAPCTSSATSAPITFTVHASPTVDAGNDASVCVGNSIDLGGSPTADGGRPGYIYQWDFSPAGAELDDPTLPNPTFTPLAPGPYTATVTVTDADGDAVSGCIVQDVVDITALPPITVTATAVCDNGAGTDAGKGEYYVLVTVSGGDGAPYDITVGGNSYPGVGASTYQGPFSYGGGTTVLAVTASDPSVAGGCSGSTTVLETLCGWQDTECDCTTYGEPGGVLTAQTTPGTFEAWGTTGLSHVYILTDANGIILAVNNSGLFTGYADGTYKIYSLNYVTADAGLIGPEIEVGDAIDNLDTALGGTTACYALCGPEMRTVECTPLITPIDPIVQCPASSIGPINVVLTPAPAGVTYNIAWSGGAAVGIPDGNADFDPGSDPFDWPVYTAPSNCVPETTISFTVTTDAGCTASSSFTITLEDNEPPVITAGCVTDPQLLACDASLPAAKELSDFTVSDDCSGPVTLDANPVVSGLPVDLCSADDADRTVTRTYTFRDACGNPTTCVETFVYAQDVTGPVITPPAPLELTCDQSVDHTAAIAAWLATATVTDVCDEDITILNDYTDYTQSCGNVITVNFNATDDCDNSAVAVSSTITFVDQTSPTLTCPSDITIAPNPAVGFCSTVVEYAGTATDNCDDNVSVFTISGPPSGGTFSTGTTVVTLQAEDDCGNLSDECSFNVTVTDPVTVFFGGGCCATVCEINLLDLNSLGAVILPNGLGGTWLTSGDGQFLAADKVTPDNDFGGAVYYKPGVNDIAIGKVILTLRTDSADGCLVKEAQVEVEVLDVGCGNFPWDGN